MEKDILGNKHIAIIGYGNMGKAIAKGLLDKKVVKRSHLFLSNSQANNKKAAIKSQIIILAVKPQIMGQVLEQIKTIDLKDKLIVSVAAGISINFIEKFLDRKTKIIRVMPNLCARVGESMSCWIKNNRVTLHEVQIIKSILESFGQEIKMKDDEDLDRVTAVSGSGPAYFFYFVEAFIEASYQLGLDKEISKLIVMQTLKGALLMLTKSQKKIEELRAQVTSKGGITEAAIYELKKRKFKKIFCKAIQAAHIRSIELNNY